ncbi:hypothetical protein CTI14_63640, partial [Methylobacterium radiotolerans]
LRADLTQSRPFCDWAPQSAEAVWRVMVADRCERLRLMFFGNLHQDWSEFVLADLGVFHYAARRSDAIPAILRLGAAIR